jgi:fibronectin-binding autotransporter adhesin
MKFWRLAAAYCFAASLNNTAEAGDGVTVVDGNTAAGNMAASVAGKALASSANATANTTANTGSLTKPGNGTFTLGAANPTTVTGTITGIDKQGTGAPDLAGVTPYVNPASVLGGRLTVNSELSSDFSASAASTLSGDGRFLDSLTATGTLAPGHALGTVNFTGSYTAGSAYSVGADAADASKRFNLGSKVQVLKQPVSNTTQTIVSATGSVSTRGQPCREGCDGQVPWNAWISAMGGLDPTLDAAAARTAAGVDYQVDPRLLLGLAAGYGASDLQATAVGGRDWAESVAVAAYGSYSQPNFEAQAIAGYGTFDSRLLGHIAFPGLAPSTTGAAQQNESAALGFEAKTPITDAAQAYFRYHGVVGGDTDTHALTAGFRLSW